MKFPILSLACITLLSLQFHAQVNATAASDLEHLELSPSLVYSDSVATDSLAIVRAWVGNAQAIRRLGDFAKADSLLIMAREFASRTDDFMVNFMAYTESGQFYNAVREPELARHYYYKVLDLIGDDLDGLARTNYNISFTYSAYYDYANASNYLNKSIEYRYEMDRDTPLWKANMGFSYLALGRLLFNSNRFDEAIDATENALTYMSSTEERPLFLFEMNSVVGELYARLGNYTGALSFFLEAEHYAEILGMPYRTIVSNQSLGLVYSLLGNPDKAMKHYLQAREVMREDVDVDVAIKSRTYERITNLLLNEGRLGELPVFFTEWEELIQEEPETGAIRAFTSNKAYFNYLLGNHELAESLFAEVLENHSGIMSTRANPEFHWRRALNMAMIDLDRGFEMAEEAISITDEYRRYLTITGDSRAEVFRSLNTYYSQLSFLYLSEGRVDDAFRVAESSGSRAFAEDMMISSDLGKRLEEQGRKEEFDQLRNRLIQLENRLIGAADEEEIQQITREIRDLSLTSEAIVSGLYANDESLKSFFVPHIVSLAEARESLSEGEAGLRMMVHETGVSAILFSSSETITWGLNIPGEELRDMVNDLRDGIMERKPLAEVNRSLDAMGHFLFSEEAREMLLTKERLTISPDGILSYVPFESLRLWEGTYMVENLVVSQTPSFTVREILRNRERPARTERRALAMTNPVFEEMDAAPAPEKMTWVERSHENLRPLPFSGMEGDWMKSYFPGEVDLLSGEMATESYIAGADLGKYSLLHFATHGIVDDVNPRLSRIVLSAPGPAEQQFDGQLSVSEIYELDLSSDLVVLSACNTGLGRLIDGEGILGFQRAFLQAGSGSVAVTLWSVEDRSTAMLMRSFYQNLNRLDSASRAENKQLDYAAALRKARLEMINRPGFNHPNQWAAFILTGI